MPSLVNNIKKLKVNLILPFHFHCFYTLPFTPTTAQAATPTPFSFKAPTTFTPYPSKHQQTFTLSQQPSPSLQSSTTHFHSKLQITLHPTQPFKEVSFGFLVIAFGRGTV